MKIDYNCFIGNWPFAKNKKTNLDELKRTHERNGIDSGWVSNLNSVLYNDPFEGDMELAEITKMTNYDIAVSINPLLPNVERDIRKAEESFEYKAYRIYPTIHGYSFDCSEFREFFSMAEDKGKPLLIACSFGDPRLDYLLKQKSVDMRGLGRFLRIEHKTPIVLCNIKMHDIDLLAKDIKNTKDIYVDTSELKHSMFAIEDLTEIGLEGRIVFGSFFPLFNFSSAYIHFYGGNDEIKNNILKRII